MINEMWVKLSRIVGHPEWGEPGAAYLSSEIRLRDRKKLEPEIEAWTSQRTRAEIVETLATAGVVCAPVNRINEAITSPLTAARGMVRWVIAGGSDGERVAVPGDELKFAASGSQDTPAATVPALGADTAAVLSEIGYDAAEADRLRAIGVVQ